MRYLSVEVDLQGLRLQLVLNLRDELFWDLALNAQDKHGGIVLLALRQSCCLDVDASVAQHGADNTQRAWAVAVREEDVAAGRAHIHATAVDAHNLFHTIDAGKSTFQNRGIALCGNDLHAHRGVVALCLILGGDFNGHAAGFSNGHSVNEGNNLAGNTGEQATHCRQAKDLNVFGGQLPTRGDLDGHRYRAQQLAGCQPQLACQV